MASRFIKEKENKINNVSKERRKFQRINAPLSVEFVVKSKSSKDGNEKASGIFMGKIGDLSEGGLSLNTTTLQYMNREDIFEDISNFLNTDVLINSKISIKIPILNKEIDGEIKRAECIPIKNKPYNFITIGVAFEKLEKVDFEFLKRYILPKQKKE